MELSPSQKTSIRYQFEVYCKKVIRGERCDYLRQVIRREEQEVSFSDLPFDTLLRIGVLDDYPSSHYVFEAQGHQISVADDRLGDALSQIESAGRDLLLLAYFLDLSDREIGALLGIPRSNVLSNEAIAAGQDEFYIPAGELPHGDSWPALCTELVRNGFASAQSLADGIRIKIKTE